MFSRNTENTYIATFRQRNSDINNFFCQFLDIFFLYLENLIGRNIRTKFQLK